MTWLRILLLTTVAIALESRAGNLNQQNWRSYTCFWQDIERRSNWSESGLQMIYEDIKSGYTLIQQAPLKHFYVVLAS